MAEFIDNLFRLFSQRRMNSRRRPFVSIEIADNFIRITDNSTGIAKGDLARAFSPSERPDDPSGLSEFGIDESSSVLVCPKWTVRTKHYKSIDEYTMVLDVPLIVETQQEKLTPSVRTVNSEGGYTEIVLENLQQSLAVGGLLQKIKSHLASIYRKILRDYPVRIEVVNGGRSDELSHELPGFLVAPLYTNPDGEAVEWHRDFAFQAPGGIKRSGVGQVCSRRARWLRPASPSSEEEG